MEELKTLGPKRNLAEELYRRIGPFDFEKNQPRSLLQGNQQMSLNTNNRET